MSFYYIRRGFVVAKIRDLYPEFIETEQRALSLYSSEKIGRDFYNGLIKEVSVEDKIYSKKEFEKVFSKEIEKEVKFLLDNFYRNLVAKNRKKEKELIHLAEMNPINRKLKRVPSLFQQKYMDKYYIYKGFIYQIVKIRKGIGSVSMLIELPSGNLTEVTISVEDFTKRIFFERKIEAVDTLLDSVDIFPTKRNVEYIQQLRNKYRY